MRGVAKDPEKEAARREKIRASMKALSERRFRNEETGKFERRPHGLTIRYAVRSRERKKGTRRFGWDYFNAEPDDSGEEYGLDFDAEELREALNKRHPNRRYWVN